MLLDRTTYPAFREAIAAHDSAPEAHAPRSYPGYPRVALPRPWRRLLVSLESALAARRTPRALTTALPAPAALGRLLHGAHGLTGPESRSAAPSAGNLQALECYLTPLAPGWLAPGVYHYDRPGHHLARVAEGRSRDAWQQLAPSLGVLEGGALLLVLAGELDRVERKYGRRAERFLLLEAGHLMQNLALLAAALGQSLAPLGGFFERPLGDALGLPRADRVLYTALLGAAQSGASSAAPFEASSTVRP